VLAPVIDSLIGDDQPTEVRRDIGVLTAARLCANGCFRFAPPFLATIARGTGVTLDQIGIAVAVAELAGLLSPLTARVVDRLSRRQAMVAGLVGVAVGTTLAAASQGMVMFVVALVILSQSKVMYDLGLNSWVSDHVPYESLSRVMGFTETSWALGLLLGVSTMGLVTGVSGWRVGYLTGAVVVMLMAGVVGRRLPNEPHVRELAARQEAHASAATTRRIGSYGWLIVFATATLMAASQSLFVTFGSWLEDVFSFTPAMLSALAFGLGFGELFSSIMSSQRTDRWGKERSMAMGAAVMVPASVGLAVFHQHLWIGLICLIVAIACFEFAIVSSIAAASQLVPGSPARGLALTLAGGTFGRALASIPATHFYQAHGMSWPAMLTACLAGCTAVAAFAALRLVNR